MRIKSDFRDYYDSVVMHGADPGVIYQRRTRTIPGASDDVGIDLTALPRIEFLIDAATGRQDHRDSFALHLLLFCGEAIPVVEHRGRTTRHLWSLDALDDAVGQASAGIRYEYAWRGVPMPRFSRSTAQAVFTHRFAPARLAEIHHRHASPVILYRNVYRNRTSPNVETEIDPVLKTLGFESVRDPYRAYQEIAMYVGGVLQAPGRETAAVSDADRAAKHGFDRWSFRRKVR